ncbi:MAG: adenylate kinase [Candidatus Anoxychlamydiales bacterium]|nr:adenylate kinase [Candidatus Anoxychlamydiales bacterium]
MKNILLLFGLAVVLLIGLTTYRNSKKEKPLVVIMMGTPGTGKGTHSSELSKALKIPHISTGDLFRENIKNETELGRAAKGFMDEGQLVPDKIVVEMLFNHIHDKGYDLTGYILDGFPRTLIQAQSLDQRLGRDYNKIALNLNIDEEKSISRITGRLICQSCQTPFHKTNLPPKIDGKCDICESDLYQRDDDTKEVIKSRFEVYNNDTKPLIDYYQKSNVLKDIDSNGSKEIVLENLLKNINQKR